MERKPVTLVCEYCKQTIYEDEEYHRENEWGPDCHETCLDVHLAKEKEEFQKEVDRIKKKEAKGKELTFDELMVMLTEDTRKTFMDSMFRLITGEEKEIVFKPKNVYASVRISKLPPEDK